LLRVFFDVRGKFEEEMYHTDQIFFDEDSRPNPRQAIIIPSSYDGLWRIFYSERSMIFFSNPHPQILIADQISCVFTNPEDLTL